MMVFTAAVGKDNEGISSKKAGFIVVIGEV